MALSQFTGNCAELLSKGFGSKPSALVIRQGPAGCFVSTFQRGFQIPPYHATNPQLYTLDATKANERVKDTTGGGNTFLGGFCHGLLQKPVIENLTVWENAALFGSVAASFAIEQLGMPKMSRMDSDACCLWNGEDPLARVAELAQRIAATRTPPCPSN